MAEPKNASAKNTSWGAAALVANEEAPAGPATRLSEIYADCFTLILNLRAARGLDDADQLRRRTKALLAVAERAARASGFADDDVHHASFALVAFIDETVYASDWDEKAAWQNKPLQLDLFDRYDAGEEFFSHLETLRASPQQRAQVLEVYYLCLALGFEGRYQLQGQHQLQLLIENINKQLRQAATHSPRGAVAPHGYPGDQTATEMRSKVPLWAVAAGGLVLVLLLYLSMSLYVSSRAGEAVRTIEHVQRTQTGQP